MIRAVARGTSGHPIVMLGLEPQNMARLQEGQPIRVNLRNLAPDGAPIEDLPDVDVVVFFAGTDEVAMMQMLAEQ